MVCYGGRLQRKDRSPDAAAPGRGAQQGQVAQSPDLTAALLLLGFFVLMDLFGGGLIKVLRMLMSELLSAEAFGNLSIHAMGPLLLRVTSMIGGAMAPLLVGCVLMAIAANVIQLGFSFNPNRLRLNAGMLNPLRGLGRIFQAENVFHLAVNLLKLALAGFAAWMAVRDRVAEIVALQQLGYIQAFGLGASIIYAIGIRIAFLMLVLAAIDYGYRRYRSYREMMMTKDEVKEEMRHMEGDPKIKQRRRQIAMQLAQQRLKKDVPTADVVITNPTEIAVALKYDSVTMNAPRLLAKGQGPVAARIRQIAIANGIPIIERKPLARALYKLVQVGQEIPSQFYATVAEILAYVYELTGKATRRVAG